MPWIDTPVLLAEMTLRAAAVVPPMRLPELLYEGLPVKPGVTEMATPGPKPELLPMLPRAAVPAGLVPMRLPCTTLLLELMMLMPIAFPETTLPRIVLPVCAVLHEDTVCLVANGECARNVGANVVAQDRVARRPGGEYDAGSAVARDDIAVAGGGPANDIASGLRSCDLDAEEGVGHGTGPGGVRADEVALHHVVAGVEDENPGAGTARAFVPRDDIAVPCPRAAHRIAARELNHDPTERIAAVKKRAADIRADVVPGDQVAAAREVDAIRPNWSITRPAHRAVAGHGQAVRAELASAPFNSMSGVPAKPGCDQPSMVAPSVGVGRAEASAMLWVPPPPMSN